MDLRQLEAFAAIMSAGSITGAARLLGRSQPALTRLIQDLEVSLGFSLLHRSGPRVTTTEQGLRFYQEVEPVLAWLRQLRERADAIAADKPRSLSIASIASFSVGMLPAALRRLGLANLPGQVYIRTAIAEQVVQDIATQVSQIGTTRGVKRACPRRRTQAEQQPRVGLRWTPISWELAGSAGNMPARSKSHVGCIMIPGRTAVSRERGGMPKADRPDGPLHGLRRKSAPGAARPIWVAVG